MLASSNVSVTWFWSVSTKPINDWPSLFKLSWSWECFKISACRLCKKYNKLLDYYSCLTLSKYCFLHCSPGYSCKFVLSLSSFWLNKYFMLVFFWRIKWGKNAYKYYINKNVIVLNICPFFFYLSNHKRSNLFEKCITKLHKNLKIKIRFKIK